LSVRFRHTPKKPKNSDLHEFEVHRPSNKVTESLFQVIKAIFNQCQGRVTHMHVRFLWDIRMNVRVVWHKWVYHIWVIMRATRNLKWFRKRYFPDFWVCHTHTSHTPLVCVTQP